MCILHLHVLGQKRLGLDGQTPYSRHWWRKPGVVVVKSEGSEDRSNKLNNKRDRSLPISHPVLIRPCSTPLELNS